MINETPPQTPELPQIIFLFKKQKPGPIRQSGENSTNLKMGFQHVH